VSQRTGTPDGAEFIIPVAIAICAVVVVATDGGGSSLAVAAAVIPILAISAMVAAKLNERYYRRGASWFSKRQRDSRTSHSGQGAEAPAPNHPD
jgi:hypothetical protein